jgi:hypothetical protein
MNFESFKKNKVEDFKENKLLKREGFPIYVPPTQEQIQKMNENLNSLKDLLSEANFIWQIDGGVNISGYEHDYVRDHKDIDISVPEQGIPDLIKLLENRNSKLFIRIPEKISAEFESKYKLYEIPGGLGIHQVELLNTKKEKITEQDIVKDPFREKDVIFECTKENISESIVLAREFGSIIFKIDTTGFPIDSSSSVDVHIPAQNENGDIEIRTGVFINKDNYTFNYTENNTFGSKNTISDSVIQKHLSPKSVFIFHKLHESRLRDEGDLTYLFNKMDEVEKHTIKNQLDNWLLKEEEIAEENVQKLAEDILRFMSKQSFNISEYEEVRGIISNYPDIKVKLKRSKEETNKMIEILTNEFTEYGKIYTNLFPGEKWSNNEDFRKKITSKILNIINPKNKIALVKNRLDNIVSKTS